MSETIDQSAKVCDKCLTGSILAGEPQGRMSDTKLAGLNYYVTSNVDSADDKTKAVILCCDIFGLAGRVPNAKLLADAFSEKTGFVFYIPDLLEGDYASPEALEGLMIEEPIAHTSFFNRTAKFSKMVAGFMWHVGPLFLYKHRPAITVKLATEFTSALREQGVTRIGAIGYCLGGVQVTLLASIVPSAIDVAIIAHPGSITAKDFAVIPKEKAVGLICAQEDMSFPDDVRDKVIKGLQARGNLSESKIYKNTTHGFAARPNLKNEEVKLAFEQASEFTLDFFKKHL